ncbi:MAG: hypothetical protein ACFFG0_10715 [Candidatus Thorarchaeota archaeon]
MKKWQLLMDSFYEGKTSFSDLYRKALDTVVIAGYSIDPSLETPVLLIHNHKESVPLEEQRPYKPIPITEFSYAHTLADFRTIFNFHTLTIVSELYQRILKYYQPIPIP